MESLRSVIASLEKGEFLASVDIQDAYLHIPIFPLHQRFLRFAVNNLHFQFTALPFGLASAPRVFTKVMSTVVSILHSRGIVVLPYLDDLLIKGPTFQSCKENVDITLDTLSRLGCSLIQQLRNLQALLSQSGAKTSSSSTCVMVLALSFCLILFPSLYPFGLNIGQRDLRGGKSWSSDRQRFFFNSRQLRGVPDAPSSGVVPTEKVVLERSPAGPSHEPPQLDLSHQELHLEPSLQGAQNDTPEIQDVGTAESKPSINSNSSSDVDTKELPAAKGPLDPVPTHFPDPPPKHCLSYRTRGCGWRRGAASSLVRSTRTRCK
ncbi:unnamed protein product [Ranitomeya imitator]|uniref:ribonuclease H n=1 Tax=Ranitomeya imitator TaxID=111125 RepID=A0ABN9M4N7_9NEOB|nr:unnamed protein product [Ranitomeya imitator]